MPIEIHWLGHATVLVEDRARILTDPLLTATMMHLHRRGGPVPRGLTSRSTPCSSRTCTWTTCTSPRWRCWTRVRRSWCHVAPRRLLRRSPLEVVEVAVGDVVPVGGATVTVVPAVHADTRWPWSRIHADSIGFVVRGEGSTYFAGDTSVFPGMADIAESLDVALLPVGGWGPSLRGHHMDPEDARDVPGDAATPGSPYRSTTGPSGRADSALSGDACSTNRDASFEEHAARLAPDVDVRVLPPGDATTVRLVPRA